MNVYPVNLTQGALLSCPFKADYSDLANLYHPYLKHRCWFRNVGKITLIAEWGRSAEADTIILADTNCTNFEITIYDNAGSVIDTQNTDDIEFINIFKFPKNEIKRVAITFSGVGELYIGYLFIGNKVELPRFIINPEFTTGIQSESGRTNGGQAYGSLLPTLDTVKVSFIRIPQDKMIIVEDYSQSVQNVIPHIIDLYPEAHEVIAPMYVTLSSAITKTKREEDNFYWNFSLSWQEAR